MGSPKLLRYTSLSVLAVSLLGLGFYFGCGGGGMNTSTNTSGTVNTSISDPPGGCGVTADHVFVTVTKVTAHLSADAGPTDSGWQTLVDLTSAPRQIDLGSLDTASCLLTQLGSTTLPAGKYQQIRFYLLANNASAGPSNNACSSVGTFNCVQPSGGAIEPLLLSSEAQTGIKIPSSQITSGGLTVSAGQAVDLNINFNAGCSLVHQGNGQWRLKPVLHAGQIQTNNNALSGTVIDSSTQKPIAGANVYLEQPSNGIDIVMDGKATNATGNFSFCPLPAGDTFDVVVTFEDTSGATPVTYNATITLNAATGSNLGNIPLVAEPLQVGTTTTLSSPANILGQVTTTVHSTTAGATTTDATAATITLFALQDAGNGKIVTIPPFAGSAGTSFTTMTTPTISNGTSAMTCPTGTKCENFILVLPASNPSVGTFTAGQTTNYAAPAANPALYWVLATSVLPSNNSTSDCTPSSIPSALTPGVSPAGTQIGVDPPPMPDNKVTLDFGFVACTSGQ